MSNTTSMIDEIKNIRCAANMQSIDVFNAARQILEERQKLARILLKGDTLSTEDYNNTVNAYNYCTETAMQCMGLTATPLKLRP